MDVRVKFIARVPEGEKVADVWWSHRRGHGQGRSWIALPGPETGHEGARGCREIDVDRLAVRHGRSRAASALIGKRQACRCSGDEKNVLAELHGAHGFEASQRPAKISDARFNF